MVTICTASLTFNNSTFCPHTVFMCFVWIWEQTAIISLYNINWPVFITETESVYRAVRTECLNASQVTVTVHRVNANDRHDFQSNLLGYLKVTNCAGSRLLYQVVLRTEAGHRENECALRWGRGWQLSGPVSQLKQQKWGAHLHSGLRTNNEFWENSTFMLSDIFSCRLESLSL